MQGIYTYIPETNHVPREYSVSAILSLLFMVSTHISLVPALALLYFYVSTFRLLLLLLLLLSSSLLFRTRANPPPRSPTLNTDPQRHQVQPFHYIPATTVPCNDALIRRIPQGTLYRQRHKSEYLQIRNTLQL